MTIGYASPPTSVMLVPFCVEIRTINVCGACHTCVVGYVKTVVCEEESGSSRRGRLPPDPRKPASGSHLTGCNQLALVGDLGIRAPAVAELGSHLTRGGVGVSQRQYHQFGDPYIDPRPPVLIITEG